MATPHEKDANARFVQRYGEESGDVEQRIELAIIGHGRAESSLRSLPASMVRPMRR